MSGLRIDENRVFTRVEMVAGPTPEYTGEFRLSAGYGDLQRVGTIMLVDSKQNIVIPLGAVASLHMA